MKTTERWDPTTTKHVYPTTGQTYDPTDYTPAPSTHKPNPDLTCYGHFTYKEGHNIIVDGKYNRHHDPVECEISCYVSRATFHFATFHQVHIFQHLYLFLWRVIYQIFNSKIGCHRLQILEIHRWQWVGKRVLRAKQWRASRTCWSNRTKGRQIDWPWL